MCHSIMGTFVCMDDILHPLDCSQSTFINTAVHIYTAVYIYEQMYTRSTVFVSCTSHSISSDVGGSSVYMLLSLVNKETALAFDRTAA